MSEMELSPAARTGLIEKIDSSMDLLLKAKDGFEAGYAAFGGPALERINKAANILQGLE